MLGLINVLAYLAEFYFGDQTIHSLISVLFITNVIFTLLYYAFNDEIMLMLYCPKYTKAETLFRVGHRNFASDYDHRTC
jgi:hypothetical protein